MIRSLWKQRACSRRTFLTQGGAALQGRIDWAFMQALSRLPTADERQILVGLHQRSLTQFKAEPETCPRVHTYRRSSARSESKAHGFGRDDCGGPSDLEFARDGYEELSLELSSDVKWFRTRMDESSPNWPDDFGEELWIYRIRWPCE